MGPRAKATYELAIEYFQAWAASKRLALLKMSDLDEALAKFGTTLFFDGESIHRFRNALFGMVWRRCLAHDRRILPKARQALTGFLKEAPVLSRDPAPWDAAVAIAFPSSRRAPSYRFCPRRPCSWPSTRTSTAVSR